VLRRPALHERIISLALALLIWALCLLALLSIVPSPFAPPEPPSTPVTFTLEPSPTTSPSRSAKGETRAEQKQAEPPAKADVIAPKPLVPLPVPAKPGFVVLSKQDYAASDIGKLPRRGSSATADAGDAGDGGTGEGRGDGPGGVKLYQAEWYREPRNGAVSPYLPARGAPDGSWAIVACRTIENYHVDNCVAVSESPLGSGLASAVRQAAWQFQVRPPRINGKPLVGAWVRIRFDFNQRSD